MYVDPALVLAEIDDAHRRAAQHRRVRLARPARSRRRNRAGRRLRPTSGRGPASPPRGPSA
jgi:hypothetical protein